MFLAKVEGTVVATKKDPNMSGRKLLLLRPQLVDEKDPTKFRPGANTIVAVDARSASHAAEELVYVGLIVATPVLARDDGDGWTLHGATLGHSADVADLVHQALHAADQPVRDVRSRHRG